MVKPLSAKLWRDIRRQKAQFAAVALTVFLGVTIFAASYDSFQNLTASYEATFTGFRFANLTMQGGDVEAFAAEAAATDGVESVQTRTVADVPMQGGATKFLGRVVGMPGTDSDVNQVRVIEGAAITDPGALVVLVEEHMAEHFGLHPGDTVIVAGQTVAVGGSVSSPEYIWPARSRQVPFSSPDNFGVVFTTEETARALAAAGPNEAVVYFAGGEPDAGLAAGLTTRGRALGTTSVFTRDLQPSNEALQEDLKGFQEMALFFPILFLVAAAMAAYVMISRLVWAQRPHIGVLLANGVRKRTVLGHYLGYGLVPGLIGALPGAVAGVLLARLITRLYTGLLAIPVTLVKFYPATLAGGVVIGLMAAALAALAPALFASRVQPAEAMRGNTPPGRGRPSLLERLIPPLRKIPIRWRMALRGVGRNPRRTIYTMLGVVLSLVLVLVSWGMIDSIEHVLDVQYVEIQQEDASVRFGDPVGQEQVDLLAGVPGVAAVEPVLEMPVTLGEGDTALDTALIALPADTVMHRFLMDDGSWGSLPAEGVLMGVGIARRLEVRTGDVIPMTIAPLGVTVEVTVGGLLREPLSSVVYASREYAAASFGTLPATSALVSYDPGADPSLVRAAVTELPSVSAFEDAKAIHRMIKDFMVLFYGFVGIMLVFGGAMAFALIFNSMTVNIAERNREVATLLAVGIRRTTISRLITAENLVVAAIAIPIGLVAGHWVSAQAMASFQSELFTLDLFIRPTTYVFSAVAIVLVALLSEVPGLRALRRISIPEVVKERSS
ncbi:MAG: FtsX-like permease family protein [Actinobacteria bacterium]|nr:FtsX-like permease family protein [Actinomycetota bacterium]